MSPPTSLSFKGQATKQATVLKMNYSLLPVHVIQKPSSVALRDG